MSTSTYDVTGFGKILPTHRSVCLLRSTSNALRSSFARSPACSAGEGALRGPIHLPGCHRTRRARAPDFLIIFQSIFMRKNLASSLSLLFSLVVFRQSQIHSIRRRRRSARPKLSTLYIISLLPPLSCPALSLSVSLSVARSHMQHAFRLLR